MVEVSGGGGAERGSGEGVVMTGGGLAGGKPGEERVERVGAEGVVGKAGWGADEDGRRLWRAGRGEPSAEGEGEAMAGRHGGPGMRRAGHGERRTATPPLHALSRAFAFARMRSHSLPPVRPLSPVSLFLSLSLSLMPLLPPFSLLFFPPRTMPLRVSSITRSRRRSWTPVSTSRWTLGRRTFRARSVGIRSARSARSRRGTTPC